MTPAEHLRTIRSHVEELVCPRSTGRFGRLNSEGSLEILALPDTAWHCAWYGGEEDAEGNVRGGSLGWTKCRDIREREVEPCTTDRACWLAEDSEFDPTPARRLLFKKGWFWRQAGYTDEGRREEEWIFPVAGVTPARHSRDKALLIETNNAFERYLAPRQQAEKRTKMEAHAKAAGVPAKFLDKNVNPTNYAYAAMLRQGVAPQTLHGTCAPQTHLQAARDRLSEHRTSARAELLDFFGFSCPCKVHEACLASAVDAFNRFWFGEHGRVSDVWTADTQLRMRSLFADYFQKNPDLWTTVTRRSLEQALHGAAP